MTSDGDSRFCFVLSPIGDPGSEIRRRANGILNEIIEPAVPDFHVERADHDQSPGSVTTTIIDKTLDADLVIADLTGTNPNVMYELAVRHMSGEPFVQIMEQGGTLPFDVGGLNTIFFENDLAGRKEAVQKVSTAAKQALEDDSADNPIQRTVQLRNIQADDTSDIGILVDLIRDLHEQMGSLQRRLPSQPGLFSEALENLDVVKGSQNLGFPPPTPSGVRLNTHTCSRCGTSISKESVHRLISDGKLLKLCEDCAPDLDA